jgi:hypothetical protein
VCISVLGKYIPQIEFISVLLGDEPVMEFPTNYYQRLIAKDQDEAAGLVEEYLETHAPEMLYDDLLIPALNRAKRDRQLGTLSDEDVQFILEATRAIVEDVSMRQPQAAAFAAPMMIAAASESSAMTPPPQILGCPAYDAADELALLMLQQLLDPIHYRMAIVSARMLTGEVLSVVEQQDIRLICVAALPPGALAPVRYLCKRLRSRFPDCRIVVGRWGGEAGSNGARVGLREAGADEVGTTLREIHNQISQLSQLVSPPTPSPTPPSADILPQGATP